MAKVGRSNTNYEARTTQRPANSLHACRVVHYMFSIHVRFQCDFRFSALPYLLMWHYFHDRKVNKSYRGGPRCPIVINCSDGSGRTGTYCLIDMVLNRMAKGNKWHLKTCSLY